MVADELVEVGGARPCPGCRNAGRDRTGVAADGDLDLVDGLVADQRLLTDAAVACDEVIDPQRHGVIRVVHHLHATVGIREVVVADGVAHVVEDDLQRPDGRLDVAVRAVVDGDVVPTPRDEQGDDGEDGQGITQHERSPFSKSKQNHHRAVHLPLASAIVVIWLTNHYLGSQYC